MEQVPDCPILKIAEVISAFDVTRLMKMAWDLLSCQLSCINCTKLTYRLHTSAINFKNVLMTSILHLIPLINHSYSLPDLQNLKGKFGTGTGCHSRTEMARLFSKLTT